MQLGGGRRRGGRRGRRAAMSEINVTPLVDVMLVLLIIFMVTAPLLKTGVSVELPESRASALPEDRGDITVTLAPDGSIHIDDAQVAQADFADRLARFEPGPDGKLPPVTLRADRSLDYGRVMAVLGELNRAGFTAIALVTSAARARPEDGGSQAVSGGSGGPE